MTKKFENKKLNKEDHAKVDKDAGNARKVFEGLGVLGCIGLAISWKKVGGAISKIVFRG